jgi:LDH2 family malate/lactate/ureidoglycolate dehydrogenase
MTLYEALYLFCGLTGGAALGFAVAALFSSSKQAVAEDMLASLIEMRRFARWTESDQHCDEYVDMLARADLAIRNATEQAAPVAAPQSYFE